MSNMQINAFIGCDNDYKRAGTVLYGAPFDGTTSFRPGTRFGPDALRRESFGLETYSPYLDKDISDVCVCDIGDIDICIGDAATALAQVEEAAENILADGKRPFLLGGEHSVTLGAVRAVAAKYPDLHIVHFDAHADLRDDYLGVRLSHACVLRRCHDILGDGRIFQFGIRSGDRSEFEWGAKHVTTHRFGFDGLKETLDALAGVPVYFTLDLDVLDPSVFPGTGTPEAGGVTFDELRRAATLVCSRANVVGCDAVELSPHYDISGVSTAVAGKIVREMLIALGR